jgi:hypothetical protein
MGEQLVMFWRGRDVDDMTREELLVAVKELALLRERDRESHRQSLSVLGEAMAARRA